MFTPDFPTFEKLSAQGNLIPIYREILGDLETPVSLLRKLGGSPYHFLLESLEGGEKWGRYSFLGTDPELVFTVRGDEMLIQEKGVVRREPHHGDPLGCLKDLLGRYRPVPVPGLPRFYGGAVGFFGYELAGFLEKLPPRKQGGPWKDEAVFLVTDTLMIFDHLRQTITIVACAYTEGKTDLKALYTEQLRKIDQLVNRIRTPREKENLAR